MYMTEGLMVYTREILSGTLTFLLYMSVISRARRSVRAAAKNAQTTRKENNVDFKRMIITFVYIQRFPIMKRIARFAFRAKRLRTGRALLKAVNDSESSLVVKIAGKTFDADIRAEYHVYEHAVISRRDTFPRKIASHSVFRYVNKIS